MSPLIFIFSILVSLAILAAFFVIKIIEVRKGEFYTVSRVRSKTDSLIIKVSNTAIVLLKNLIFSTAGFFGRISLYLYVIIARYIAKVSQYRYLRTPRKIRSNGRKAAAFLVEVSKWKWKKRLLNRAAILDRAKDGPYFGE